MTTYTFGEVSWDQELPQKKPAKNQKDVWLKLKEGRNELRIVTGSYQYIVHKYKGTQDAFEKKIKCSMPNGSCKLCEMGNKPKIRWYFGAISRKTGKYGILDVSSSIYQQLNKLAKHPKWGSPTQYDVSIEVDPNGGATGYYTVQPDGGKEPLSAEDQNIRDKEVDLDFFARLILPPEPEFVENKIRQANGEEVVLSNTNQAKPSQKQEVKNQQPKHKVKVEVEEDDFPPAFEDD